MHLRQTFDTLYSYMWSLTRNEVAFLSRLFLRSETLADPLSLQGAGLIMLIDRSYITKKFYQIRPTLHV